VLLKEKVQTEYWILFVAATKINIVTRSIESDDLFLKSAHLVLYEYNQTIIKKSSQDLCSEYKKNFQVLQENFHHE